KEIMSCITKERPRLICLANPNSPTGTIILPHNLEQIIKTAHKYSTVILVDEAYYLYYPKSVVRLINKYPNLVITRTFSKAYGLASGRVGYAVGNRELITMLYKVRPMYEVNAIGAKIVELLLSHPEITNRNIALTIEGKKYLEDALDKMELFYFKSYANFVLIEVGSFEKSSEIVQKMKKRKILIKGSFSHRYLKNCIRVTIGSAKQMRIFLRELKDILKRQSQ
ncbi:MAG: histidinol-phosphate transaminase, partial [Nanoarchaeota archaeon]